MSRFHPSVSWKESSSWKGTSGPKQSHLDFDAIDDQRDHSDDAERQFDASSADPAWCSPPGYRNYFLPLHYEPNYHYPLIVWLHSDGYNENQVDQVMPHISVRNYIAAGVRGVRAVDSIGHRFDWHDSPSAIHAAHESVIQSIDEASRQFSVHPERVVLAGYGSGAEMATRIALRDPYRFAAVVSLGGNMPSGSHLLMNLPEVRKRRLSMLWLCATGHSSFDESALNQDIRMAQMLQASVEVRRYPADDEMDTVVLSDMNQWIMRHVVANEPSLAGDRWSSQPTTYSAN